MGCEIPGDRSCVEADYPPVLRTSPLLRGRKEKWRGNSKASVKNGCFSCNRLLLISPEYGELREATGGSRAELEI
jgi:hypothetical protein